MGPSGRRGAVIPVHGRWPGQLTVGWSRQRPILVINRAPEMLSLLAFSIIPTLPAEEARTHDQASRRWYAVHPAVLSIHYLRRWFVDRNHVQSSGCQARSGSTPPLVLRTANLTYGDMIDGAHS